MKRKIFINFLFTAFLICGLGAMQTITAFAFRANGKIAFTSNRDGNDEIYVMNADGSGQTRLTNNTVRDNLPAWSPDGKTIAFESINSGVCSLNLMNADGTNVRPFPGVMTGCGKITWSPNGQKIAFTYSDHIYTVRTDGTDLADLSSPGVLDHSPSWSPDGSMIVFIRNPQGGANGIYVMQSDGSNAHQIVPGFYYASHGEPSWSPDGSRIIFAYPSQDDLAPNDSIGSVRRDGSDFQSIIVAVMGDVFGPKYSPDGRQIVFFRDGYGSDRGNYRIWLSGSPLTDNTSKNFFPDWQSVPTSTFADFDGDIRADISVFRPADGIWYLNQSTDAFSATQFGLSTDKLTPADYDGDGKTDIAVYRNGSWFLQRSATGFLAVNFGAATDVPMPADYSGDGKADLAVFRPADGGWYLYNLTDNQFNFVQFGQAGDVPVPADYDGDGKTDVAVFRGGVWYLQRSQFGFAFVQFGIAADKPIVGDYDGDGKTDQAVYRSGTWYVLGSSRGFSANQFGLADDVPTAADYDGDGKTDIAVFRPSNGVWYLQQSQSGFNAVTFGAANDKPVPNAFIP